MEPIGRPQSDEAIPYYFGYIDQSPGEDPVAALSDQLVTALELWRGISEEASLRRYQPGKWSLREVLSHLNDTERVVLGRAVAVWLRAKALARWRTPRGFDTPLPSFEQEACVEAARADAVDWRDHVDEFEAVRRSTLAFFRNLPRAAWLRRGIASGSPFSVRALAFILAGHVEHHAAIVRRLYL